MTPKEKAEELINKYLSLEDTQAVFGGNLMFANEAKQCALIAVENEYNALRELLFNLRSTGVIENEKVYLFRLQELIDLEEEVKQEIEKL